MHKIAILIIPPRNLNNIVLYYKKIVKKKFNNQKYLSHPVHLTLFAGYVENYSSVQNHFLLKKIKNKFKKTFDISIEKKEIFFNDIFTGGNTMVFSVKKNNNLLKIQKNILFELKPYLVNNILNIKNLKNISMRKNYEQFGFPFVGKNWIPHFTVASINKRHKTDLFFKNFLKNKIDNKNYKIIKISFFKVYKNKHNHFFDIKF
tara:strand:+ start:86 stop:697 length:612 start_codon:yes stop_codon:yes gene_type:complete